VTSTSAHWFLPVRDIAQAPVGLHGTEFLLELYFSSLNLLILIFTSWTPSGSSALCQNWLRTWEWARVFLVQLVPFCIQLRPVIAHLLLAAARCIVCEGIRFLEWDRPRFASSGSPVLSKNGFGRGFLQALFLGWIFVQSHLVSVEALVLFLPNPFPAQVLYPLSQLNAGFWALSTLPAAI